MATVLAVWAGAQTMQMNSASAQMPAFTGAVMPLTNPFATPLTNSVGFTNTLVQVTNVSALQMSDVLATLLTLQTNIEEALPVLSFLTTNVNVPLPAQTGQMAGAIAPITSAPAPLTPTGAATGHQQPTSFSMTVGTNTFTLDPATLQGLVQLRDDLERALPVVQQLNGTAPTNVPNAAVTSAVAFTPTPVRNGFFTPFTNMPPSLIPGFP